MKRIGWIVDTQKDFMYKDGRLYVKNLFNDSDPGAETIISNLVETEKWMRENCDLIVFTGDWHGHEDAEIDATNPDPEKGTYPPHCMGRSSDTAEREGAKIIEEIRIINPTIVNSNASISTALKAVVTAIGEDRDLFIQKTKFDVFEGSESATDMISFMRTILNKHNEVEFVVMGVATDVCVTAVVDGMLDRGYTVRVIKDAIYSLGIEADEDVFARWERKGGVVTTLEKTREAK